MKNLLPFFLLFSSCGWFNADKNFPTNEPVAPPPIDVEVEDRPDFFYYVPVAESFDVVTAEQCEVDVVTEVIGPYKVETSLINFVYGTIDFDESIDIDRDLLHETDHVHAKEVWLEVAAGENFNFFSWARINLDNTLVAWGGPEEDNIYRTQLHVDGSVDLLNHWRDRQVRATGEIRGRVPGSDTWVQGRLTFIRFFNCD